MALNNLIKIFFVLFSLNTFAAPIELRPDQYRINTDGSVDFDLINVCKEKDCQIAISSLGISIQIASTGLWKTEYTRCVGYLSTCPEKVQANPSIASNTPILGIRITPHNYSNYYIPLTQTSSGKTITFKNTGDSEYSHNTGHEILFDKKQQIFNIDGSDSNAYVISLKVDAQANTIMGLNLKNASNILYRHFTEALRNVDIVKGNIAKRDARHFTRYVNSINEAIGSLGIKDGKATVSITRPTVKEKARFVLTMGMVLNEIFEQYDHVRNAETKAAFGVLQSLNQELREDFGCSNDMNDFQLACEGSKALSSLASIIELEAREIALKYIALSDITIDSKDTSPFNPQRLRKIVHRLVIAATQLRASVDARNGGDAAAEKELDQFINVWNEPEWQNIIRSLENAGRDLDATIQPRLRILLTAAVSMQEFLGNRSINLVLPREEVINKLASGVK